MLRKLLIGSSLICGSLLVGCLSPDEQTAPATAGVEQGSFVIGDHSILDQRAQYGLTSLGLSSRKLGVIVPQVSDFPGLQNDVNAARAAAGFPPLTFLSPVNQAGSTVGPFPAEDPGWAQVARIALTEISAAAPNSPVQLIAANSSLGSDLLVSMNTAVSPSLALSGALDTIELPETDANVQNIEALIAGHPNMLITSPSGSYPGTSPEALGVATSDYTVRGTDTVWSGSTAQCSVIFAATPSDPALCAGKRTSSDVASVGHQLPIQFHGAAINVDSRVAAPAFWLGRAALQPAAMPTRSQILASIGKVRDVTAGTDSSGNTAVISVDKASGFGVPAGNLSF